MNEIVLERLRLFTVKWLGFHIYEHDDRFMSRDHEDFLHRARLKRPSSSDGNLISRRQVSVSLKVGLFPLDLVTPG